MSGVQTNFSLMERLKQIGGNRQDRRTVLKLIEISNARALTPHEKDILCGVLRIQPDALIEEPGQVQGLTPHTVDDNGC